MPVWVTKGSGGYRVGSGGHFKVRVRGQGSGSGVRGHFKVFI